MGLKKLVVDALALGPTSRGFTGGEARRWVRESYRHRTRDYGFSKKETRWALRHGFLPEQAARLGITAENSLLIASISLLPINKFGNPVRIMNVSIEVSNRHSIGVKSPNWHSLFF